MPHPFAHIRTPTRHYRCTHPKIKINLLAKICSFRIPAGPAPVDDGWDVWTEVSGDTTWCFHAVIIGEATGVGPPL